MSNKTTKNKTTIENQDTELVFETDLHNEIDQFLRLTDYLDEDVKFFFDKTHSYSESDVAKILNSRNFKNFIKIKNKKISKSLPFSKIKQLIAEYLMESFEVYNNLDFLNKERDADRWNRLNKFGIRFKTDIDSFKVTQYISAANKRRILSKLSKHEIKIPIEIEKEIDALELFFSHNSRKIKAKPNFPLMSPNVLQNVMNFEYGLSSAPFNRFIGSDRHVYFHTMFRRLDQVPYVNSREYGDSGLLLDLEYSKKHAMVTPFVMYDYELLAAAKKFDKSVADQLWSKLPKGARLPYFESNELITENSIEISKNFELLKNAIFTVDDFSSLVKVGLKLHFSKLRAKDAEQYLIQLNMLRAEGVGDLSWLISHVLSETLDLPSDFETTVPTAVPGEMLKYIKNPG